MATSFFKYIGYYCNEYGSGNNGWYSYRFIKINKKKIIAETNKAILIKKVYKDENIWIPKEMCMEDIKYFIIPWYTIIKFKLEEKRTFIPKVILRKNYYNE